jgi:hypothetical protein
MNSTLDLADPNVMLPTGIGRMSCNCTKRDEEAQLAELVGSDADNSKDAVKGESYEVDIMYLEFAQIAKVPEIQPRPLVLKKFVMTRWAIGMHSKTRCKVGILKGDFRCY